MSSLAITTSSLTTSLSRYGRSMGLWILLLVAPVGARFMIAARGDDRALVSVNGQVPWLTSQTLGMAVGVVIATLLLPAAFIYLRANVNKRQPWQVEEVTPASRAAIMFGRWLADVTVLAAVLAATSAAACVLALFMLPLSEVNLFHVIIPIWAIAAPPMAMTASLRIAFDARKWTRGWLGEVLYFVFWMGSIVVIAAGDTVNGYAANMLDLPGFMSPLSYARGGLDNFVIGGGEIRAGAPPIILDIMSGIFAPGYLASRITWLGIAALIPLIAALVYAPHVVGRTRKPAPWLKLLQPGRAPAANPAARPARAATLAWLGVLISEIRLIASGRLMMLAMAVVAVAGAFVPWSTVAAPAAMLLLVFGATAHAGRSEQVGLLALTRTGLVTPMARRVAFVAAGGLLATAMSAGAIAEGLMRGELRPAIEAPAMGAATALTAIALGAATRSGTAPRLLLLIAWYGYLNWGGGTPAG